MGMTGVSQLPFNQVGRMRHDTALSTQPCKIPNSQGHRDNAQVLLFCVRDFHHMLHRIKRRNSVEGDLKLGAIDSWHPITEL